MLFLYELKNKHNAASATRNINAEFGNGSANECIIRRWYTKFETRDESLTNEDRGRPETGVENEVLRPIVEEKPGNTVRDYADQLGVSPRTISRHLKLIGKVKKK